VTLRIESAMIGAADVAISYGLNEQGIADSGRNN